MNRIVAIVAVIFLQNACLFYANDTELLAQEPEKKINIIAIASTSDSLMCDVAAKFGRAEKFIIYNLEKDSFTVFDNKYMHAGSGAGTGVAEEMVTRNVDAVITQGCGQKSLDILQPADIKVFLNVRGTVKDAIEDFRKGKLKH